MIPGGFTPTDRPTSEREVPHLTEQQKARSARTAWLTLAAIVVLVAIMILLLSLIPDV
jgi:hypothetical protein